MENKNKKFTRVLREFSIIVLSVLAVVWVLNRVQAGSITPPGVPAATMRTLDEVYNPLVGTFDSSAITANRNGNALEMMKCSIQILRTGTCP